MFVAMGLSALFPVLHGVALYGIDEMRGRIGLTWLVLQGVLYILGAGIYAVSSPAFLNPPFCHASSLVTRFTLTMALKPK
jgi:adiponectin receptor